MAEEPMMHPVGLKVKNTFLEPDEDMPPAPPLPGQLARSHTAPPHLTQVANTFIYFDDPNAPEEAEPSEGEPGAPADDDGEEPGEEDMPPPPRPEELARYKTNNPYDYEPQDYWDWGDPHGSGGDGVASGMEHTSAEVLAQQQMMMAQMNIPMAPGQMMPGQFVFVPGAPQAFQMPPYAVPQPDGQLPPTEQLPHSPAAASPTAEAAHAQPLPPAQTPPAGPPLPQTLQRTKSATPGSQRHRVAWTVDARKLRGNDKQAVSPSFELSWDGNTVPFKLMIYPKISNDQKGGASFKKSRGRGSVTVKCEADLPEGSKPLKFRIFIGSGETAQPARGPIKHDFSASAVCSLPREWEEWDFTSVVDQNSSTFVVCLEIQPLDEQDGS